MKRQKTSYKILQEAEVNKPDGIYTVSCPFTEEYFKAYQDSEKKIIRDVDAYAEAYFSAEDIRLH